MKPEISFEMIIVRPALNSLDKFLYGNIARPILNSLGGQELLEPCGDIVNK